MTDAEGRAAADDLVELLRRVLAEQEAAPDDVVHAAKEAWTWRTIDAELAALTYDSALDVEALTGVRGTGAVRTLAFEADDTVVEVEVTEEGERRGLVGQLSPVGPASVLIEWADGRPPHPVTADDLGRFRAARLARGVVRLRIARDGHPVVTSWLPL